MSAEGELRALLAANEAQRQRVAAELARTVAASEQSNADDEHDPEGATIAFERQQLAALLAGLERTAEELTAALAAEHAGRRDRCERCGRPIGAERLAARPQARTCIDCARLTARRR